jgi:hypothetical protein
MKINWLLVSLSVLTVILCSFMPYPGGAPSPYYYTGSPSDAHSCASCHGNASNVTGWITSNIPAAGYIAGTTYQITATNTVSGSGKYGFEVSPQSISGILLGTLAPGTNSKLVGSGKWITQSTASNSVSAWTFNWTAPAAGTGSVTFYGSFCRSTGSATKLSTLVVSEQASAALPGAAGPITGSTIVCQGTNSTYSISAITAATSYVWSVPAGASITSGQGTTSVVVNFGTSAISGNISVYGTNTLGNGTPANLAITVNTIPLQAGIISGVSSACEGSSQTFSVVNVAGLNYNWFVPTGYTITAGQGSNSVTVTIGHNSGNIEVVATNECGTSPGQAHQITVLPLPGYPTVIAGTNLVDLSTVATSEFSTAGANGATSYYWNITPPEAGTISGTGLTGTVNWNISFMGWAFIKVKALNECGEGGWSDIKEVHVINSTGLVEESKAAVTVYPSPNNGNFNISLKGIPGDALVRILSPSGIEMYSRHIAGNSTSQLKVSLASGLYFLIIETDNETLQTKLIIK